MNCEECKETTVKTAPVSFQSHQADMARMERTNTRLCWVVLCLVVVSIVLAILLFAAGARSEHALLENNQKWIDMWREYDFESYEQDGEGVNIIGSRNGVDFDVTAGTEEDQEEQGGEGPSGEA